MDLEGGHDLGEKSQQDPPPLFRTGQEIRATGGRGGGGIKGFSGLTAYAARPLLRVSGQILIPKSYVMGQGGCLWIEGGWEAGLLGSSASEGKRAHGVVLGHPAP